MGGRCGVGGGWGGDGWRWGVEGGSSGRVIERDWVEK